MNNERTLDEIKITSGLNLGVEKSTKIETVATVILLLAGFWYIARGPKRK